LKEFVLEVTKQVPSPQGGSVYEAWQREQQKPQEEGSGRRRPHSPATGGQNAEDGVHVGDLGSGSDYTPFIQHLGVPATDIGSDGPYGVYHSVFDNYNWFTKFADPTFVYEQQQARVFGLEILHMADADVLPYDYKLYGAAVVGYLNTASQDAAAAKLQLDFAPAMAAAQRFEAAGTAVYARQAAPAGNLDALNAALRDAEEALLNPQGLPKRPWFRHTIYAPGEYTGYAAVVIPGVTEAISAPDAERAKAQLAVLADALNRAAGVLEAAAK
jgi:N-acetylated-alpha-linked acidic dipeptidase